MLDIIPYIPQNTLGVKQELWKIALQAWKHTFVELLDMPDSAFITETSTNTSLAVLVEDLLSEHIDGSESIDKELLKFIFLIYNRLASIHDGSSLLLDSSKLCKFAVVYNESNLLQVRHMMQALSRHDSIESTLLSTLNMLIDVVQDLPNALSAPASIDALNRAYVMLRLLNALFSATATCEGIQDAFNSLDQPLIDCYKHLNPLLIKTVEHEAAAAPFAYLVKQSLVSLFNLFVDIRFFAPLGYTSDLQAHEKLIKLDNRKPDVSILDPFGQKILFYIVQSGLDSSRRAFVDGPLVMDWEVEYHVSEKLRYLDQHLFGGDNDQLGFLVISMEQVRDTNEETGSWGDSVRQQKAVRMDETEMSNGDPDDLQLTAKISELHDVFPHLGDGFLQACLEANNYDVGTVVMQVLEDNLPESVQQLDQSMSRETFLQKDDHQPNKSILASRHNIYDNDEFDVFANRTVDTSRVYEGKKDKGNADSLLDDKSFIHSEKKNVLQRVVDMYDDDYDDTYDDINDAGIPADMDGDSALDVVKKKQQLDDPGVHYESMLVHAFVQTPQVFDRNREGRKSKGRIQLKKETGMSDEQIEGWAIMLSRNPRKQRILDKYMLYDGNQTDLPSKETEKKKTTEQKKDNRSQGNKKDNPSPAPQAKDANKKDANKKDANNKDANNKDANNKDANKNDTSSTSDAKDKAYKNKNKARFGNHNRKAQRDKKMAKAGPPAT